MVLMRKDYIEINYIFSDIKVPSCYPNGYLERRVVCQIFTRDKKKLDSSLNKIKCLTSRILRITKNK